MSSIPRVPIRALAAAALALFALPSFAVIATSTGTTPEDADYAYVGRFDDASGGLLGGGVVVGDHLILTARHVVNAGNFATSSFVLGGATFHPTEAILPPDYVLPDATITKVDLALIRVSETFSGHYLLGSAPTVGTTVTMVGFGQGGGVATAASGANNGAVVSAPAGTYYANDGAMGVRRKGDNTLDNVDLPLGGNIGPSLLSYLDAAGEATLADRDSGGGWFQGGRLVGISSFVFNDTQPTDALPKYRNFGFASANLAGYSTSETPGYTGMPYTIDPGVGYFGSGAVDLTNRQVDAWLRQNGVVPEPGSMLALGLGTAALARRGARFSRKERFPGK